MQLLWPAVEYLESYAQALRRGWSPNTTRPEASREELAQIEEDPALFLASQVDREAKGPPVVLPDGSTVPRLPGYRRWMWDGEFCGIINFRWQPGTSTLPAYCLGHIGYSVVPWKRYRGYATKALKMLLDSLDEEGLTYVELTTSESNPASIRVIEANGGALVERFTEPAAYGGREGLRYRIDLVPSCLSGVYGLLPVVQGHEFESDRRAARRAPRSRSPPQREERGGEGKRGSRRSDPFGRRQGS